MPDPEFQITRIVSTPFEENCFVARLKGAAECLIIDPGFEPERIFEHLEGQRLRPAAILNTHGHADHIAGNAALKERWPDCPLVVGRGEETKLVDPVENLSRSFGIDVVSPAADVTVADGDHYTAAGFDLLVRVIPGHSSGHVVYLWEKPDPTVVFVGDVIFAGSIGRTDFPGGSFELLRDGIHAKLFSLPDDTLLLPGHGGPTSVGTEKRSNPFVALAE